MAKVRTFGADDRVPCPKCGKPMFVTRRTIDLSHDGNEAQVMTCSGCDTDVARSIDQQGQTSP